MPSEKTIGRLSLYRRLLANMKSQGETNVFSHQLATQAGGTAAQVRRDVMAVGYVGSPTKGYDIDELIKAIGDFLDAPEGQKVALVGVGNLGKALLAYFTRRGLRLTMAAAFDVDPEKANRVVDGCRCYPIEEMQEIVKREGIEVAIITVPAEEAQNVTDQLCAVGVNGLLNFAPVRLWVPAGVYVEDLDMSVSLEKAAYFAGQHARKSVSK